jgi:plasmid maintenance system killer protein
MVCDGGHNPTLRRTMTALQRNATDIRFISLRQNLAEAFSIRLNEEVYRCIYTLHVGNESVIFITVIPKDVL